MSAPTGKARLALAAALLTALLAGLLASATPVRHLLATAENTPARAPLAPPLFAEGYGQEAVDTLADWEARRTALLAVFEREIYGAAPAEPAVTTLEVETLPAPDWVGTGVLELRRITITPESADPIALTLAVVRPQGSVNGVFFIPADCGLRAALSDHRIDPPTDYRSSWCGPPESLGGDPGGLVGALFGKHILTPPLDRILEAGYAAALFHDGAIGPDERDRFDAALLRLGVDSGAENRPGLISVWAWTLSAMIDAIEDHPELGSAPVFAYGHSRRGKAALLAAARDDRIALTLVHQSGTTGAAPHADATGEPVASMVKSYPHWFTPRFSRYAGNEAALSVNQHQLIALLAPRALHLGGANRDSWADPKGAETAARAAAPAWTLYGEDPGARVSSHLRPGTHGVTEEDWTAFLAAADRATARQPPRRR
ncbi:MAG: hypothetical protein ABL308_11545 [Oceanicaulis sp.]